MPTTVRKHIKVAELRKGDTPYGPVVARSFSRRRVLAHAEAAYGVRLFAARGRRQTPCCATGKEAALAPHPLLSHLREPGPHCRGCWAVDAVLGKS